MKCVELDESCILEDADVQVKDENTIILTYNRELNAVINIESVKDFFVDYGTGFLQTYDNLKDREDVVKYAGYIEVGDVTIDSDTVTIILRKPAIEARVGYLMEVLSKIHHSNNVIVTRTDLLRQQNETLVSQIALNQLSS